METVGDFASEFARRARAGGKPRAIVQRHHAELFLIDLAREGFEFARDALKNISDPELRRIIEAIFFSTATGVVVGGLLGGAVGGPAGARVGMAVGGAAGAAIALVALTITATERDGALVVELQ